MIQMLDWLPTVEDLPERIRRIRAMDIPPIDRLAAIRELTDFNRDTIATGRIDGLCQEWLRASGSDPLPAGLSPLRLTLLSSHTVDHLVPAIRVSALGRGVAAAVQVGAFGAFRQTLLSEDAAVRRFAPNVILLALDIHALLPAVPIGSSDAADCEVASAIAELRQLWREARERYGAEVIQQTFLPMTPPIFGSFDALVPASPTAMCSALNQAVRAAARADGVALLDVEAQLPASAAGAERLDIVRWHQAKQLINPSFAPLYGDHVARVLAAITGRSRKCLVLDLDNTLWGGVIGDDGLAGIRLGQGSAEGEAYLAFQRYIDRLRQAGIVLAVCSKNDDAVARAAFEQHGEMALKLGDISCFTANWADKAANIRSIAATLNLGLDSLVFVDDNPAERAIVRRELPQVAVPELPDDVAHYPARLAGAGYFEAVSLTADDLARTASYAANAERQALSAITDLDGYLQSLEMRMVARPISPADLPRAVQLINKTNQFNLTTRRRTAAELETFLASTGTLAYGFRLRDRFGDNGLISVILARPDPLIGQDELLIDTWLMSCRVLGRGVEKAALDTLIAAARRQAIAALIGEYRPTERNGVVAGMYADLGFEHVPAPTGAAIEATFWRLAVAAGGAGDHYIALEAA